MNKNDFEINDLVYQYWNINRVINKKADKWKARKADLFRLTELVRENIINHRISIIAGKADILIFAIYLDGFKCNLSNYCDKNQLNYNDTMAKIEKSVKELNKKTILYGHKVIITSIG